VLGRGALRASARPAARAVHRQAVHVLLRVGVRVQGAGLLRGVALAAVSTVRLRLSPRTTVPRARATLVEVPHRLLDLIAAPSGVIPIPAVLGMGRQLEAPAVGVSLATRPSEAVTPQRRRAAWGNGNPLRARGARGGVRRVVRGVQRARPRGARVGVLAVAAVLPVLVVGAVPVPVPVVRGDGDGGRGTILFR